MKGAVDINRQMRKRMDVFILGMSYGRSPLVSRLLKSTKRASILTYISFMNSVNIQQNFYSKEELRNKQSQLEKFTAEADRDLCFENLLKW